MARPEEPSAISGSSARMLFIVSSNVEQVDPATRKLIRSHVMRGKKQKKPRSDWAKRASSGAIVAGRAQSTAVKMEDVIKTYVPLLPGRVGSDLSFVEFADEMDPLMVLNIKTFSTVAIRIIFPLMAAIGFQVNTGEMFYPCAFDAAALHITAFAVEGFIDRFLRRQGNDISEAAMLHFQKGLRLLRQRLSGDDEETKLSDSTMGVVLKLACTAHFDGHHQAARQHMAGLRRMVFLRGGLDAFKGNRFLTELLRVDLSIALLNGSTPLFFRQPSEPVIDYPEKLLPSSGVKICFQDNAEFINELDNNLATTWWIMRKFCLLVNLGAQTQSTMNPEIIHGTMVSVIYRLLHMNFADSSIDEVVRLGLLAFSHHIFLQWQDIKLAYPHFRETYRDCILDLKLVDRVSSQLALWLLMTGAISLFNISEDAWLRECLQERAEECRVETWKEMRDTVKSFMWIELLDDVPGQRICDFLHLEQGRILTDVR